MVIRDPVSQEDYGAFSFELLMLLRSKSALSKRVSDRQEQIQMESLKIRPIISIVLRGGQ